MHVNDPEGRGPGFEELQFAPALKAFIEGGYQDYAPVEVFDAEPDSETIDSRSVGYLHGMCDTLGHSSRWV